MLSTNYLSHKPYASSPSATQQSSPHDPSNSHSTNQSHYTYSQSITANQPPYYYLTISSPSTITATTTTQTLTPCFTTQESPIFINIPLDATHTTSIFSITSFIASQSAQHSFHPIFYTLPHHFDKTIPVSLK